MAGRMPVVRSHPARGGLAAGLMVLVVWAFGGAAGAVETGRLVEKEGRYVFVESQDPSMKLLLDRALRHGWISQEEYDRVVEESETRAQLLQPSSRAWYDRGFNFSMNDNRFFLKIRFRSQMRLTQRFRNEAWRNPGDAKNFPELLGVFGDYRANRSEDQTATTFNLRRVRLYFMGHLFSPDFRYYIQVRAETAENAQSPGGLALADFVFTSTHAPLANVQIGQYKVFFNRSQINSTASMQFAERALVMDAFTASGLDRRDIGVTIMNDEEVYPFNYYFGVYNGTGPSFNRFGNFFSEAPQEGCPGGATGQPFPSPAGCPAAQRNINANLRSNVNQLMYAARLQWNILGRPGYGEGDQFYSETPQLAIGGGYAYNPSINTLSNSSFVGTDLANLNIRRQLAAFGNGRQLGWGIVDYSTWAADAVFKYRGFSLQGEYFFKNITRHDKGRPCMNTTCTQVAPGLLGNSTGWYVQTGYYLIPRYLEIAGRYAYWDPDTRAADDLVHELDFSLNWFLNGTYDHQIFVTYSNIQMGTGGYAIGRSAPLPPGSSNAAPLDAVGGTLIEHAVRIQYQIFF